MERRRAFISFPDENIFRESLKEVYKEIKHNPAIIKNIKETSEGLVIDIDFDALSDDLKNTFVFGFHQIPEKLIIYPKEGETVEDLKKDFL